MTKIIGWKLKVNFIIGEVCFDVFYSVTSADENESHNTDAVPK